MDKTRALDKVKARLERLRNRIRSRRRQIINEAVELLEMGLDADDVFEELRDAYIDAVPLWSQKADDLVDFERILPGLGGQILEMVDGLLIDRLLRLFVRAAERRHSRRRLPTIGQLRDKDFATPADLPQRDWAPKPVAEPDDDDDDDDDADADSALGVDAGAGSWGMDGAI